MHKVTKVYGRAKISGEKAEGDKQKIHFLLFKKGLHLEPQGLKPALIKTMNAGLNDLLTQITHNSSHALSRVSVVKQL